MNKNTVKQLLSDLNKKCHDDVSRAMSGSMDLVKEAIGNQGIYAMTQKLASTFVEGAAICLASLRGKETPTPGAVNNDDVMFAGIVAILTSQKPRRQHLLADSLKMFEGIQGYPYKLPYPWHVEH